MAEIEYYIGNHGPYFADDTDPSFTSGNQLIRRVEVSDAIDPTSLQYLLNKRFGSASHHTKFENAGTMIAIGDARCWKDVFFVMGTPMLTGPGNPSLVTWNGNLRGFSFGVGDAHDFDPQEFPHDGVENSDVTIHLHWISRTNVSAVRTVKFEIEYSLEPDTGAYPIPTVVQIEFSIPAYTPVNTPYRSDIAVHLMGKVSRQMFMRLKRVASSGTEPEDDPVVAGVHYHYLVNMLGSHTITTK